MISKKNPKVNLEKKRKAFFHIGLLTSLSLTLLAFEWSAGELVQEDMKLTEETDILPPEDIFRPPVKKQKQQVVQQKTEEKKGDDIELVDNTKKTAVVDSVQKKEPDLLANNNNTNFMDSLIIDDDDDDDVVVLDSIYKGHSVDVKASFPGGNNALFTFLKKNVDYPERAQELGVQGRVFVQFVVEIDGSVSQVKAVKGPKHGLRKEAERVTKLIPKWNPATVNGKPVRSFFSIPFQFTTGH